MRLKKGIKLSLYIIIFILLLLLLVYIINKRINAINKIVVACDKEYGYTCNYYQIKNFKGEKKK
ncbi:MAG: hypothetical protein RR478_05540 [Bacilli bacterium]